MNAEKFLERTTDPEIRILASLVFSREGDNDTALKRAQMLQDLKKRMETEIVHFFYRKGDGSLRSAYGTRDHAFIKEHLETPRRTRRKRNPYGHSPISTSDGKAGAHSGRSRLTDLTWNMPYEELNSRCPEGEEV